MASARHSAESRSGPRPRTAWSGPIRTLRMTLIDRIGVEAMAATEEVRRVIDDLRPSALDSAALGEAIGLAADRVAAHVSVELEGDLSDLAARTSRPRPTGSLLRR